MAYIEMFPEAFIQLQKELLNHPTLCQQLNAAGADADLADRMGIVCAYCGIVLDGYYDADEVEELAEKCTAELRRAREELVLDILAPIPSTTRIH